MQETRDFLESIGLPGGDLNDLPDSDKRFPDGAQYRVEIPSTEGPECFVAILEESDRLDVIAHRVSQGSGVFLHIPTRSLMSWRRALQTLMSR